MSNDLVEISKRYLRFSEEEARGRSPLYEAITLAISRDAEVLAFLSTFPREKQQPNLLLAAFRHLHGVPGDWQDFRQTLLLNADAVRSVMMVRSTQTNEPGRCAVLLPILAQLPGPLALIEVGASAGLCLLPDFYGYRYGQTLVGPTAGSQTDTPVFSCELGGDVPLPMVVPDIVWRAGLDLNPLDVSNREEADWLETLVWPEQIERAANLGMAMTIAQSVKPRLVKGDLRGDLDRLAAEAPSDVTLVIFHTAVLSYVQSQADRDAFAEQVQQLCPYWISNESPRVFPEIAAKAPGAAAMGRFLMAVNGKPVAWSDPHGAAMDWL